MRIGRVVYINRINKLKTATDQFKFSALASVYNAGNQVVVVGAPDQMGTQSYRLQCIAIGIFFSGRYLLDVLFTPHAVQGVLGQVLAVVHRFWSASWCAPAVSLVLLHYWGSFEYGLFGLLVGAVIIPVVGVVMALVSRLRGYKQSPVDTKS